MKQQGTVVRWDAERAFGFIRSPQTASDIFFHRRDYSGPPVQPYEGMAVQFEEIHVGGKGPRALSVEMARNRIEEGPARVQEAVPEEAQILPAGRSPARPRPASRRPPEQAWPAFALMGLWLLLWLTGIGLGRFPWVILTAVVLINLATFYVYWRDKHAATHDGWRVPEERLHLLAAVGGWPGAWFAQQILRHKSVKPAFRAVYWLTVGLNLAALLTWIVWPWLPVAAA
jgi:uncharacterized membrane protein YsdA (DUF1294 family)/cold shock CspA family protein